MQYNVVSSDDHVQEPGDLWTKRAPAKLRDRVPVPNLPTAAAVTGAAAALTGAAMLAWRYTQRRAATT